MARIARVADAPRRRRRFLLAAVAAGVLAAVMGGCVVFKSTSSTQLEVIGKVRITTIACASDGDSNNTGYNPADTACQGTSHKGNSGADAANNVSMQLKVAYRVPNGAIAPSSFTSVNTSNPPATACGGGITFNENASYANALEALSSSGPDQKWVGYLAAVRTYTTAGCQYFQVRPEFGLAQGFGVAPFQGPFNYRAVVGFRQVDESTPGNTSSRTVTCGSSITSLYTDGVDGPDSGTDGDMSGICADDPTASTISTNLSQATRDLGVIPTSNSSVSAGQTANVSFNAAYRGAVLPSGQFNLSANTTVPGATATPSPTSLVPAANSDNTVNVSVPVPPATTPGTYNVFLIATLSTNPTQTRGGIAPATITVGEAFGFSPAPDVPSLGTITLNGQAQAKTAQMSNFSVIDSPGSSDQGWNVTVVGDTSAGKPGRFAQYCTGPPNCGSAGFVSGGHQLLHNSLNLNTSSGSWSGGNGSAPSFNCNSAVCPLDSASTTKIASAPNGGGTALWSASGFNSTSLALSTPTTLRSLPAGDHYRLDVVWTLNSGP